MIDRQLVVLLLGFRLRLGVFAMFLGKLLKHSLVHSVGYAGHARMVLLESLCAVFFLVNFLFFVLLVARLGFCLL